ncbi:hypothetical protein F7734_51390 [Scytonema sp. UIC 10036]|uniref:hypothetical protein n=1 Tax=Scytonema sp. UIC 10036 TaxID=2304196 RepID=UPI0012DA11FB|nr:hypothetical protein [Scytonema sp. UIC 10036]MUH00235.1 hypothetical protein [Scytonema sp. UIC 10036]
MMSNQLEALKQQRISRAREALQRSRDLRNSRRTLGVDGIRQFVKDVDGDWLDNWANTTDIKNLCLSYINLETLVLETFLYLSVLSLLFVSILTQYCSERNFLWAFLLGKTNKCL